jgi:hypothetical protein
MMYFKNNWKNELNFCKEFGSEDKLYCGTYCCNTFSRSESGAETRSQTLTTGNRSTFSSIKKKA